MRDPDDAVRVRVDPHTLAHKKLATLERADSTRELILRCPAAIVDPQSGKTIDVALDDCSDEEVARFVTLSLASAPRDNAGGRVVIDGAHASIFDTSGNLLVKDLRWVDDRDGRDFTIDERSSKAEIDYFVRMLLRRNGFADAHVRGVASVVRAKLWVG